MCRFCIESVEHPRASNKVAAHMTPVSVLAIDMGAMYRIDGVSLAHCCPTTSPPTSLLLRAGRPRHDRATRCRGNTTGRLRDHRPGRHRAGCRAECVHIRCRCGFDAPLDTRHRGDTAAPRDGAAMPEHPAHDHLAGPVVFDPQCVARRSALVPRTLHQTPPRLGLGLQRRSDVTRGGQRQQLFGTHTWWWSRHSNASPAVETPVAVALHSPVRLGLRDNHAAG